MAVAARSPGSSASPSARPGLGREAREAREGKEDVSVPRVPCPLCGGAIHPVAGRCKHCKQDLTSHRGRGAGPAGPSGAPLPRLAAGTGPMGQGSAVATIGLPSYPVEAEAARARSSWLRNWPLLVITLAVVGMIVALVLLILPQHDSGARRGKRLPGSDNMETDVLPKSGKAGVIDPWAPSPRSSTPPQPNLAPPRPTPLDPAPTDDDGADPDDPNDPNDADALPHDSDGAAADPSDPADSDDVFGGLIGPDPSAPPDPGDVVTPDEIDRGQLGAQLDRLDALGDPYELFGRDVSAVSLMSAHSCARAAECGGRRGRIASCARLVQARKSQTPPPQRCSNSVMLMTCLQQIDTLPCDVHPSMALVQRIPACLYLLAC